MDTILIENIRKERRRLIKRLSALEVERCGVLSAVDKAQFMPFDLRDQIHDHYAKEIERTQEEISGMTENIKRLEEEK